jgi:hypothetical protein
VLAHQWVDNGPGWAVVRLATAREVLELQPDLSQIPAAMVGAIGAYPDGSELAHRRGAGLLPRLSGPTVELHAQRQPQPYGDDRSRLQGACHGRGHDRRNASTHEAVSRVTRLLDPETGQRRQVRSSTRPASLPDWLEVRLAVPHQVDQRHAHLSKPTTALALEPLSPVAA